MDCSSVILGRGIVGEERGSATGGDSVATVSQVMARSDHEIDQDARSALEGDDSNENGENRDSIPVINQDSSESAYNNTFASGVAASTPKSTKEHGSKSKSSSKPESPSQFKSPSLVTSSSRDQRFTFKSRSKSKSSSKDSPPIAQRSTFKSRPKSKRSSKDDSTSKSLSLSVASGDEEVDKLNTTVITKSLAFSSNDEYEIHELNSARRSSFPSDVGVKRKSEKKKKKDSIPVINQDSSESAYNNTFASGVAASTPKSTKEHGSKSKSSSKPESPSQFKSPTLVTISPRDQRFTFKSRSKSKDSPPIAQRSTFKSRSKSKRSSKDDSTSKSLSLSVASDEEVDKLNTTVITKSLAFSSNDEYEIHELNSARRSSFPSNVGVKRKSAVRSESGGEKRKRIPMEEISWNELKNNFFVGIPTVYRLCSCEDHICNQ